MKAVRVSICTEAELTEAAAQRSASSASAACSDNLVERVGPECQFGVGAAAASGGTT